MTPCDAYTKRLKSHYAAYDRTYMQLIALLLRTGLVLLEAALSSGQLRRSICEPTHLICQLVLINREHRKLKYDLKILLPTNS